MLVVPDGTLWEQSYDPDGKKNKSVEQKNRIPFYINKVFNEELSEGVPAFVVTFVEIVTEAGLLELIKKVQGKEPDFFPAFILDDEIKKAYTEKIKA